MLAEDLLAAQKSDDGEQAYHGLGQAADLPLWRSLYALAQHLLISNLAASPAGIGIWQQLHQTYAIARRLDLVCHTPDGASDTLQNIYFSAILLACAQPASFTSREVDFVAAYLERFADRIDSTTTTSSKSPAMFWVDPARDAAAFACSRKSAPPETSVLYSARDSPRCSGNSSLRSKPASNPGRSTCRTLPAHLLGAASCVG